MSPDTSPSAAQLQDAALAELQAAPNYQRWLASQALPFLGDHPLEIGSGLGDYAQLWLELGVPRIAVSEHDQSRAAQLRQRFAANARVEVVEVDLFAPLDADYSCLVSFNVLEHIERDAQALAGAHKLLRPGGFVFALVPAFPFAYSKFDAELGHHRRYTKRSLRAAVEQAGLEVVELRYFNAPGLIVWFVGMKLLRLRGEGAAVGLWDRIVVPLEAKLEKHWRPPFGQSCIVVARVPAVKS